MPLLTATMRKAYRVGRWVFPIVLAVCCVAPVFADESAIFRLNEKLSEIDRMHAALTTSLARAAEIRTRLDAITASLVEEIRREKHAQLSDLPRHPRIRNNLELIRSIRAFAALLDEKIANLELGMDQLNFYANRIRDDVRLLEAVDHMTVDSLVTAIDRLLGEYETVSDGRLIDAANLKTEPVEMIWSRLAATLDGDS